MKKKHAKTKTEKRIKGIQCPNPICKERIFSWSVHDYHHCKCGEVAVDGGREYLKFSFKIDRPKIVFFDKKLDRREP